LTTIFLVKVSNKFLNHYSLLQTLTKRDLVTKLIFVQFFFLPYLNKNK
jgi:hypothetical protein